MNLKGVSLFMLLDQSCIFIVAFKYFSLYLPIFSSFAHLLFQSEEALLATRLVLPRSPGCCAFLYNDELVYACSTGMGRLVVPDEKISFSSPGEEEIM